MDFLAVPDAWPSAAAALHVAAVQCENAELSAGAFRDRAVRILEELSASSPHAAELVAPRLDAVRKASGDKLARMAGPLAADIGQLAQAIIEVNQECRPLMGL
jgi:hypothetical protein